MKKRKLKRGPIRYHYFIPFFLLLFLSSHKITPNNEEVWFIKQSIQQKRSGLVLPNDGSSRSKEKTH